MPSTLAAAVFTLTFLVGAMPEPIAHTDVITDAAPVVINSAVAHGWEAGLIALALVAGILIALGMVSLFVWITRRRQLKEEERADEDKKHASDVDGFVRDTLVELVRSTAVAIKGQERATDALCCAVGELSKTMAGRPCCWSAETQASVFDRVIAQMLQRGLIHLMKTKRHPDDGKEPQGGVFEGMVSAYDGKSDAELAS